MDLPIEHDVPLAPLTTFELGGPARFFIEARDEDSVIESLRWAETRGLPVHLLGGGSNLVVSDAGYGGLVIRAGQRGLRWEPSSPEVLLTAAAGEPWDDLVSRSVERGLAGLECLSGIPGLAGASPIQNIGAYGQEVSDTLRSVRVFDRTTRAVQDLPASACELSYRDSAFRREPHRWVVLSVTFALRPGGAPAIRYPELQRALDQEPSLSLGRVRDAVLSLRRAKGMVLDPTDPLRRSAGSFFTNPVLPASQADEVVAVALREGIVSQASEVPRYAAGAGRSKLAAGWLIERAGIRKGLRRGHVGVSPRHALALVHHGGGTTSELIDLARYVRDTVRERFGVLLEPEPVLLGTSL